MSLDDTSRVIDGVRGDALELLAEFESGTAKEFGLRVRRSDDGKRSATIAFDGRQLDDKTSIAQTPGKFYRWGLRRRAKPREIHVEAARHFARPGFL